jgi:hypothetical protein
MAAFALSIFTGAFLLFQVQPLIGKYILPWFGGAPAVWTTCLLFFQVVLLGGYAYAHFLSQWLKPRAHVIVHLALLATALALLPITPSDAWKPTSSDNPTLRILALLAVSLGLPYFVLSSTGPLMQQWFSQANPGRSPYRLYALSNVGSLLALVSYPFFVETHFTRKAQAAMWGWGLVAFVLFCAFCASRVWRVQSPKSKVQTPGDPVHSPHPVVGAPGAQELAPAGPAIEAASNVHASRITHHSPNITHHSPGITHHVSRITPPASRITLPNPRLAAPQQSGGATPNDLRPSTLDRLLWLLLPACASMLLLAITNKMCQDTAVIPFLWVLPLALYLVSFIVCFDNPRWYKRPFFTLALVAVQGPICWAMSRRVETPLLLLLTIYSAGLFVCCMVCHGELYRLRPDPRHLTSFYLTISAGGALGGVFVAVVAPLLFQDYYELHWGLLLCGALLLTVCLVEAPASSAHASPNYQPTSEWRWLAWLLPFPILLGFDRLLVGLASLRPEIGLEGVVIGLRVGVGVLLAVLLFTALATSELARPRARVLALLALVLIPWAARKDFASFRHWPRLACYWLALGLFTLSIVLWVLAHANADIIVERTRDFYGVLSVLEDDKQDPIRHQFRLAHGRVIHGLQPADPIGATWPTLYYDEKSGAGLSIRALPHADRRVGLVGLGIGTLAAYARTNDYYRFYEINPEVLRLATSRFSYLSHCYGKVEYALGDARLSLEREPAQHFDLLVLDAFAGDAIPTHLLTREAFLLYERHLKPKGVVAVHVSNAYLDLEPVLANIARELNYEIAVVDTKGPGDDRWWVSGSVWVLLTHDMDFLNTPTISGVSRRPHEKRVRLWTDDFASLFQILD